MAEDAHSNSSHDRASRPAAIGAARFTPRSVTEIELPHGVTSTRRSVMRKGALVGASIPAALLVLGLVARVLLGSDNGSTIAFVFALIALPALPVFGVPAETDSGRIIAAVLLSLAAWLVIGAVASMRVAKRPLVGWKEWSSQYWPIATGMVVGAVLALLLAAFMLGAL
jgi:hypothetical protein